MHFLLLSGLMLFAEVACQALPTWEGSIVNTTLTSYNTQVNYTCADDLMFETGEQWRIATCTDIAEWTPPIVTCVCK